MPELRVEKFLGLASTKKMLDVGPQFCVEPSHDCMVHEGLRVARGGWFRLGSGLAVGGPYDAAERKIDYGARGLFRYSQYYDEDDNRHMLPLRVEQTTTALILCQGDGADSPDGEAKLNDTSKDFDDLEVGIGHEVYIYAGTDMTPGSYRVTAVSSTSLTLDGDPGNSNSQGDVVYNIKSSSSYTGGSFMGWLINPNDPDVSQPTQRLHYNAMWDSPLGSTQDLRGEFVILNDFSPDGSWIAGFRIILRCTSPHDAYTKTDCYQIHLYQVMSTANWSGQIVARSAGSQTAISSAVVLNAEMGKGQGARRVKWRATVSGTTTRTINLYLNDADTPTLTATDQAEANPMLAGPELYGGVEVRISGVEDADNVYAKYYGFDNLESAPSASSARIEALAVVGVPDVHPGGPDLSAHQRLVLAYAGNSVYMAGDGNNHLSFQRLFGWPEGATTRPVFRPTDVGVMLVDGRHRPMLTNGLYYWAVGINPPYHNLVPYAEADQAEGAVFTLNDVYEYVYTFFCQPTNEESEASEIRSYTIPKDPSMASVRLQVHAPRDPQVTHLRLYRRKVGVGTTFRRVLEVPLIQEKANPIATGSAGVTGGKMRYEFQAGGAYVVADVGGERRLSKSGPQNPDWTTTGVAATDELYVTWKDGEDPPTLGPYTVLSVAAGYVVLQADTPEMTCTGNFILPDDGGWTGSINDEGQDFDPIAVDDTVKIISGTGATIGEYLVHTAGGPGDTQLRLKTDTGDGYKEDCFYEIYLGSNPLERCLYLEDAMADADVPLDEDRELPTAVGPCPMQPWAFEQFGRRGFWVGSEWSVLLERIEGTTLGAMFNLPDDLRPMISQIQPGDLLIWHTDYGVRTWMIVSTHSDGYLTVDKWMGASNDHTWSILQRKRQPLCVRHSELNEIARNPLVNEDMVDGNDELVTVRRLEGALVLIRERSIWTILGMDPHSWVLREREPRVGGIAPQGVTRRKGLLFIAGSDGVHTFDGMRCSPQPITEPIEDIYQRIPAARKPYIALAYDSELDLLLMAYSDPTVAGYSDENNQVIAFDPMRGTWSAPWNLEVTCWAEYSDANGKEVILFGTSDGQIGRLWSDSSDSDVYTDGSYEDVALLGSSDGDVSDAPGENRGYVYDAGHAFGAEAPGATHVKVISGTGVNVGTYPILEVSGIWLVVQGDPGNSGDLGDVVYQVLSQKADAGASYTAEWWGGLTDGGYQGLKRVQSSSHVLEADYDLGAADHGLKLGLWYPDGTKSQSTAYPGQPDWRFRAARRMRRFGEYIGWTDDPINPAQKVKSFAVRFEPLRQGR